MNQRAIALLSVGHFLIDLCQGVVPALVPFLVERRGFSLCRRGGPGVRDQRDLVGRAAALRPARRPAGDVLAVAGEHPAGGGEPGAGSPGGELPGRAGGVRPERAGRGGLPPGGGPQGEPRQRRPPDDRHELFSVGGGLGFRAGARGHDGPGRVLGHRGLLALLVPTAIIAGLLALFVRSARPRRRTAGNARRTDPSPAATTGGHSAS